MRKRKIDIIQSYSFWLLVIGVLGFLVGFTAGYFQKRLYYNPNAAKVYNLIEERGHFELKSLHLQHQLDQCESERK